jgi:O-methyltransferase
LYAAGFVDTPPSPSLAECTFYHAVYLPGVGEIDWEWDLRPGIASYLGGVSFDEKRVLEVGPASGFVTAYMEDGGADVLSVELPEDYPWDIVPYASLDVDSIAEDRTGGMRALRNAFWYAHGAFGLSSRVFYGGVSELPDSADFDISVLGAVLLHCRDPLGLLEACARRTTETIVVTELSFPELNDVGMPVCRLVPDLTNDCWHTWWSFTPRLLERFLEVLGFTEVEHSFHEQLHRSGSKQMFTVVGSRPTPGALP